MGGRFSAAQSKPSKEGDGDESDHEDLKASSEGTGSTSGREESEPDEIEDEMGDILFVCANLARRLGVDPEAALRRTNEKFSRRFKAMEKLAERQGNAFGRLSLDAQEALWQAVKRQE